jgi:GNAT superfamily N-acetyltransferase
MTVYIERARREQIPEFLDLVDALADFEKLPRPDADARERLSRDGWPENNQPPRFAAWLAELESAPGVRTAIGYAITFETYSSFLARPTMYLEDIFVHPSHRGVGAGSALMRHLIQQAWETGCGRMEWVVLDWNTGAQRFYERVGARRLTEWYTYRLQREEMLAAANSLRDSTKSRKAG